MRTAAAAAVPPVPEVVAARLAGVWAEAVQAARAEHEHAVEGWRAQVEQVETERDEAISAADELAAAGQRDAAQAATQLAAIQEQLTQQQAAASTLRHDLETRTSPFSSLGSTALSARCGGPGLINLGLRTTQQTKATFDAEASTTTKGETGMSGTRGQRTPRTPDQIRSHNRAHRDGSGITAAIALGGAVIVVVLGLLRWLT